ncbi:hypothetical protein LR48_Vigan03g080900 [Vigna angularis]|uniref:Uncharacterized protein n=1 Tax=Phaseolus angularis TaxID=3914 RepID=A0A0L9U417_PHAAN|nr:hypothetical protein LR48_Vigan03g080900 [Vigna angularis]
MASSSHPSRDRGKAAVAVRNSNPSRWISDKETRERFLRGKRIKTVVPHKYLNLDLFEKEGFHFQEWIETQGLSTFVQMKERLYVHEGLNKEEKMTTYILAWVIMPGRVLQDRMTTEDVYLLYAIKNDVSTNWVEVIKGHMISAGLNQAKYLPYVVFISKILTLQGVDVNGEKKCSCNCSNVINRNTLNDVSTNWVEVIKGHMISAGLNQAKYLPYVVFISKILTLQGVDVNGEKKCSCNCSNVINRNTLTSIGLVKSMKGWCFKDEEDTVQSSGSTPALNEDRTNFFPETNFEQFVVEQFGYTNERITRLEGKI